MPKLSSFELIQKNWCDVTRGEIVHWSTGDGPQYAAVMSDVEHDEDSREWTVLLQDVDENGEPFGEPYTYDFKWQSRCSVLDNVSI